MDVDEAAEVFLSAVRDYLTVKGATNAEYYSKRTVDADDVFENPGGEGKDFHLIDTL